MQVEVELELPDYVFIMKTTRSRGHKKSSRRGERQAQPVWGDMSGGDRRGFRFPPQSLQPF